MADERDPKMRGLGRGLNALFEDEETNFSQDEVAPSPSGRKRDTVGVGQLRPSALQPRHVFDDDSIKELSESIAQHGVLQPLLVRRIPDLDGEYEIIGGERRWRAAQMAELDAIPAVIREVPDEAAIAMSLIENIQRENLNPMEEALALSRLKEEFGLTHQQVADAVGKSRAMVTNLLRLMSLEADVKKLLEHGDLEMGHARALLSLTGAKQVEAARTVVAKGLSVRQTETLVREFEKEKPAKPAPAKEDPNVRHLINDLSDRLGAPVQIQQGNAGKGKLVISYNNLDELDGILAHIK